MPPGPHRGSERGDRRPAPDRLGQTSIYVIPTAAVATMALILLGPGSRRVAVGARVRGVPVSGAQTLALRIEGVRRLHGVDDAAVLDAITVSATNAAGALRPWTGATGPDGVAEASLEADLPLDGPVEVRVTRGAQVLAEGVIALGAPESYAFQLGVVRGTHSGDLDLRVDAVRGQLAAPFRDPVRISVTAPGGAPLAGAAISVSAVGGTIEPETSVTDARGSAVFTLEPQAHSVELTARASEAGGRSGQWEGALPVRPGAIWLDARGYASARRITLLSPAPRERAYVSIVGEHGRVFGAVVPLARDARGFFAGELLVPAARGRPGERLLYAVVAGDPYEQGAGTVAWPIVPPEGAASPRTVELLLDGVPAAEAREATRVAAARQIGVGVLGVAAVLEVLLLFLRGRASQRRLEEHLWRATTDAEPGGDGAPGEATEARRAVAAASRENPAYRTLAFAALIVMAFAIVAALASVR